MPSRVTHMKNKRGNPNWGNPTVSSASVRPNSFEEIVRKLRLSPDEYLSSVPLKEWVRKNKDHKYVPSDLLKAGNFEAASDI